MSLSTLKDSVYSLLNVASADQAALDTLTLMLFNQSRLTAERNRDWNLANGFAYLRVTASTGSLLSAATDGYTSEAPSGSSISLKTAKRVEARINTEWVPVSLKENEAQKEWDDRFQQLNTFPYGYPTAFPAVPVAVDNNFHVWWHGGRFFTNATTDVDLRIYGQTWLTAYASFAASDDFLITYGNDWLMWSTVIALNHRTQTFLPRQEGSLDVASPRAMRDEAWESLILWDAYMNPAQLDILARS